MRVITRSDRTVDVNGIDDHQMSNLPIVTAGGVAKSTDRDVIGIMNQYAGIQDNAFISAVRVLWKPS